MAEVGNIGYCETVGFIIKRCILVNFILKNKFYQYRVTKGTINTITGRHLLVHVQLYLHSAFRPIG